MTSRGLLIVVLLAASCAVKRPPAPRPIDCEQIERAEEKFPDECGEPVDPDDEPAAEESASEGADPDADSDADFDTQAFP